MAYNSDASISWTTIGKKGRHTWISPFIQSESLSCYNTISKAGSFVDNRNVFIIVLVVAKSMIKGRADSVV